MHTIKSQARKSAWNRTHKGAEKWIPYADRIGHRGVPRLMERFEGSEWDEVWPVSHVETALEAKRDDVRPTGSEPSHALDEEKLQGLEPEAASVAPQARGFRKFLRPLRKSLPWKQLHCDIPIAEQLLLALFGDVYGTWMNALFPAVAAGFVLNYTAASPVATFCVNFVAIFPTARILSYAVDDICLPGRATNSLGLVLNNTFNNATQLISAGVLLKARLTRLVHFTLMGSIFSNLLLMTGLSFLVGGLKHCPEQKFNAKLAHTIGMLLLLATLSLIIPTVADHLALLQAHDLELQSRGTAVVILISYTLWLIFQLGPDHELFVTDPKQAESKQIEDQESQTDSKVRALHDHPFLSNDPGSVIGASAIFAFSMALPLCAPTFRPPEEAVSWDPIDWQGMERYKNSRFPLLRLAYYRWRAYKHTMMGAPLLDISVAFILLASCTVIIGFNTEFAANNIQSLLQDAGLSEYFVGLIILPVLSFEPASLVYAKANRLDLSISLTLDRCMMTALMVVPLIILLAWAMGVPDMTLSFDAFTVVTVFVSIVIVTYVVHEGRSNWLMGALLIKVYVLVAIAAFFIHQP